MRLYITGSDERSAALKQRALEKGHVITEKTPDAVILPLPKAGIKDMKRYFPQGQKIIGGKMETTLQELIEQEKWQFENVLEDETFLLENARLTAEGAVWKAMNGRKKALCYSRCMVVGYGRIARLLTDMLRGFGSQVTVAARSAQARLQAGEHSIPMERMKDEIGEMDFVFNTVPFLVIGEDILQCVKKGTVLMELASAPYGIDMHAAEKNGLQVQIEGGLPGRYSPADAAKVWLDYIERSGKV